LQFSLNFQNKIIQFEISEMKIHCKIAFWSAGGGKIVKLKIISLEIQATFWLQNGRKKNN